VFSQSETLYSLSGKYCNNTLKLTLASSNGFSALANGTVENYNTNCFVKKLNSNIFILVFNEWTYASQPPMVSVILVLNGQMTLIYNKPMYINSIQETDSVFSNSATFNMTLQPNTVEWIDSTSATNSADLHQIWWNGSLLMYQ
jgi:hypothetical protein